MTSLRHHFVPQGYLRGFSCPAHERQFVWVYDKRINRAPKCKSVKSVAYANAYYAQELDDGTLDTDTLEKSLAVNIDTKAAELIAELNPAGKSRFELTEDQAATLAFFIGISLTRVPSFRDGIRDMYSQIAQHTAEILAPKLWSGPGEPPKIKATAKEWVTLSHMLEGAEQIAESLTFKDWQFFSTASKYVFHNLRQPCSIQWNSPCKFHV